MDVNVNNMKLVLRFLKEARLFPLFMEYVYKCQRKGDRFVDHHWSNACFPVSVLGQTLFTDFLKDNGMSLKRSSYNLFAIWLKKMNYPNWEHLMNSHAINETNYLTSGNLADEYIEVDKKKKKTTLKFLNKEQHGIQEEPFL